MEWLEWVTKPQQGRAAEAESWVVPIPSQLFHGKQSRQSGPELLFGWIEAILPPGNWDLGLQHSNFSALLGWGHLFIRSRVEIRPEATSARLFSQILSLKIRQKADFRRYLCTTNLNSQEVDWEFAFGPFCFYRNFIFRLGGGGGR